MPSNLFSIEYVPWRPWTWSCGGAQPGRPAVTPLEGQGLWAEVQANCSDLASQCSPAPPKPRDLTQDSGAGYEKPKPKPDYLSLHQHPYRKWNRFSKEAWSWGQA